MSTPKTQVRAKRSEFSRGWHACLAVLCEIGGQANATEKELWFAGGCGEGADPCDLATLAKYGLTPSNRQERTAASNNHATQPLNARQHHA